MFCKLIVLIYHHFIFSSQNITEYFRGDIIMEVDGIQI